MSGSKLQMLWVDDSVQMADVLLEFSVAEEKKRNVRISEEDVEKLRTYVDSELMCEEVWSDSWFENMIKECREEQEQETDERDEQSEDGEDNRVFKRVRRQLDLDIETDE